MEMKESQEVRGDREIIKPTTTTIPVKATDKSCTDCSDVFSRLPELFLHGTSAHSHYTCLYCFTSFKFSKELMVHLHREHRVPPLKFSSGKEYIKNSGEGTSLLCVECNSLIHVDSESDPNILTNHECTKEPVKIGIPNSRKMGSGISGSSTKTSTSETTPLATTTVTDPSLKLTLKDSLPFPPTKPAPNSRSFSLRSKDPPKVATSDPKSNEPHVNTPKFNRPSVGPIILKPIKKQHQITHEPGRTNGNKSKPPITTRISLKLGKSIEITPANDEFYETVPEPKSPTPPPPSPPKPTIDPLLLEPDSEKRIDMLIKELANYISEIREEENMKVGQSDSVGPIELLLSSFGTINTLTDVDILTQMLDKSSNYCDFCRQAKLIRVDKRQLVIHLLSRHDWITQFIRTSPETKFNDELSEKKVSVASEPETKPIIENGSEIKVIEDKPTIELEENKLLNSAQNVEEKKEVMEIDEAVVKDEILEVEMKMEGATEQHSTEDTKAASQNSFFDFTQDENDMVPKTVQPDKFRLGLLTSVFRSGELVYSYQQKKKLSFGLSTCQCLICGFFAETQLELFPHWRKAHRGMAMKCVMCHGKFLFAGALFSHLCLGTPQYFQGKSRTPGTSTPLPVQSSQLADGGVEAEGGNDTILLRYHCGMCDNLELPGFFNYMVHLRKDHLRCELCLEAVSSQKDLEHHMKKHKLNHFCWKCAVTYCAKPNFMTHLFWKHGTESRECSVCLKKKWPHIYHFCIPPQVFTCDVCGLYFTRSKALLVHKRLHTKNNLKSCPDCPEKFISKSLLQKHSVSVHSSGSLQLLPQIPDDEQVPTPEVAQSIKQLSFDLAPGLPSLSEPNIQRTTSEETLDTLLFDTSSVKMNGDLQVENLSPKLVNGETGHTSPMEIDDVTDGQLPESMSVVSEKFQTSSSEETQPSVTNDKLPLAENGTLNEEIVKESEQLPKQKRSKKSKDAKFKLDSILGPNLSEDESSSGDESCNSEAVAIVTPHVPDIMRRVEKTTSIERLSETDSDSDTDTVDTKVLANLKKDCLDVDLSGAGLSMPSLDILEELVDSPPFNSEAFALSKNITEGSSTNDLSALLVKPTVGLSPRLDLSSIATASLLDYEKSFEQPLSPPKEVPKVSPNRIAGNLILPQTPNLPDHISIENALLSIKWEHDYCKLETVSPSKHKRKSFEPPKEDKPVIEPTSIFSSAKNLKMKSTLPASKLPEALAQKRKRAVSSSSSSSSSSCGSNCSCSSSSSSSSSSDSSSSDSESSSEITENKKSQIESPIKHSIQSKLEIKIKKGRLPKAVKPTKVKKPKGRPPKGNKKIKFMGKEQLSPEKGGGFGENEILKHFDKPDDAFILEEDLDTEDSGSEEVFHKKQLTETINAVPSLIDEPWTVGNEKFLLQQVRGVKDLEELRPKPEIQAELPIKNPPIKSLIVRRSIGNELEAHSAYNDTQEFTIGNTTIRGRGSFQTTVGPTKTTLTISRAVPSPAMAIPASGLVTPNYNNNKNPRKALLPAPGLIPLNHNSSAKAESPQLVSSTTHPVGKSSGVQRSDSINSELHNSILNRSLSTSAQLTPTPLDASPKPRKARTKITPRRQDKVEKVVISLEPTPTVPAVELDHQLYCICRGPHDAVSQMIGCDAKDCQYQWFHFECVGVIVPPKGKWYCPECKEKRRQKTLRMKTGESPNATMALSLNGPPRSKNVNGKTFIGHPMS